MKSVVINLVTLLVLTLTVVIISTKTPKSSVQAIDNFAKQASEAYSNAEVRNTEDAETTTAFSTTTVKTKKTLQTSPSVTNGNKNGSKAPKIEERDGLTYVNGVLIANKTYKLPDDYSPGLDPQTNTAFETMRAAAQAEGLHFEIISGFRSYSTQKELYDNYAEKDGKDEADRYSARPGHSEHQTGLALDLNSLSTSFEDTPEGKWLAKNCYKYGFIIRYQKDKESITGYMYEPWHVRYLGIDLATKVYNSGLCLEEYLGIKSEYKS